MGNKVLVEVKMVGRRIWGKAGVQLVLRGEMTPKGLVVQQEVILPDSTEDLILPSLADKEMTMLPCEFCEELCPAEDLILHQVWDFPGVCSEDFSVAVTEKGVGDIGRTLPFGSLPRKVVFSAHLAHQER